MRLAAVLRGRIQDGSLRPGDRAPSIPVLAAEQGGWARQTCAKALQMLDREDLLIRVHGLGYFVAGPMSAVEGDSAQPPILQVADLLRDWSRNCRC